MRELSVGARNTFSCFHPNLGGGCHSHVSVSVFSYIVTTWYFTISQLTWSMPAEIAFYSTCQEGAQMGNSEKDQARGGESLRTTKPWAERESRNRGINGGHS